MTDSPLLSIRGLKIEGWSDHAWRPIVKGVSLDLRRGEVLGLIGESGAGKSTIGLAAMGYARDGCRITDGEIWFDGVDLAKKSERYRRRLRGDRISYVAQSAAASFNPAHTLIAQYAEAPRIHGVAGRAEAQKDAVALYERMRLPNPQEIGFRYPHQVSGGQLQRAMTAMALSCRPDLIIFDEPTTALDVTTQIEVLAAIRDAVHGFNAAAIYITHDLAVVAQMADRIMVLRHGETIEEAPTGPMIAAPQEPYTKSLWAVRTFRAAAKPLTREEPPALRLEKVSAAYGTSPVLHDVSVDIRRGRTVAMVGESGSGKSTAAKVVTGLLPPSQGRVLFNGKPLPPRFQRRSKDQLRRIQMIYQMADTALNPKQRVGDIIGRPAAFYLGLRGGALSKRIDALMTMVDLDPAQYRRRFPGDLSGGQKQRVGIARALAAEPDIVICDEVTSALDQLVAEEVLRLLDRLQQELGVSYLFITHDLATVRAIADDIVVMQHGRVVEQGTKEEVLSPPHPAYTQLLLESAPEMDPAWLDRVLASREQAAS